MLFGIIIAATGYYLWPILFKPGWRGFEMGVVGLLIAFTWGYRTIELDPPILLHPIEILIWPLFFKALRFKSNYKHHLPFWAYILLLFSFWGLILGNTNEIDHRITLSYFKNFILFFPLFFIIGQYLRSEQKLGIISLHYVIAISIISFFGVFEYYFNSLTPLFPGFFSEYSLGDTTEGFQRATFSFWGTPTAGHVIICGLPLLLIVRKRYAVFRRKFIFFSVLLLNIVALYITGNRADWLTLFVLLILYLHLYEKIFRNQLFPFLFAGVVALAAIAVNFIDEYTKNRFVSGIIALQGKADYAQDSSGFKRSIRLKEAMQTAFEHPFGVGWGGVGWVHSDFTQLTAELGLIPGIIFLGAYIHTYRRAARLQSQVLISRLEQQNLVALLLCFTAVGIMLLINGHYMLAQCGVPLFFVWATLHVYMKFVKRQAAIRLNSQRKFIINEKRHYSPTPNV